MTFIKKTIPFLTLLLLIPIGVGNAIAQEIPGEIETTNTYEKTDILHAFEVMGDFITIDDNHHFVIDITSARNDSNVTDLDIIIIQSYAVHHDNMMDIVGAVGTVNELGYDTDEQIELAVDAFENSEFSSLFDEDMGSVGNTLDVVFTSYNITPIHHGAFGTWCGGAYHDPHRPDPSPTTYSGAGSLGATQNHLQSVGYHMTAEYASWQGSTSQPYDFSKIVGSSNYSGLCDYGAFRDHAGILRDYSYRVQEEEPNPEVLSYIWPSPFWGLYTAWWHDNY